MGEATWETLLDGPTHKSSEVIPPFGRVVIVQRIGSSKKAVAIRREDYLVECDSKKKVCHVDKDYIWIFKEQ